MTAPALQLVPPEPSDDRVWTWFRGPAHGARDHIYPDCPQLIAEGGPVEGVGWLDPHSGTVCPDCACRYGIGRTWRLADEY